MTAIITALFFVLISCATIVAMTYDLRPETRGHNKAALVGCSLIFLASLYIAPNIAYNSHRAEWVHNDMLVEMYEEQLPSFEKDIERFSALNPGAMALENHDTPIATTMRLRADMIRDLTRAKQKAYNARVEMSAIENSIFSYATGTLKEEHKSLKEDF